MLGISYFYILPNRDTYLDVICTLKTNNPDQPILDGIKCKLGILLLENIYNIMLNELGSRVLVLKSYDARSDSFYRHIGFEQFIPDETSYIINDGTSNYFRFSLR